METKEDPMLTPVELADELQVTVGALAQWRFTGIGPAFIRLGQKSIRYRRSSINRFLAEREFTSTADSQRGA